MSIVPLITPPVIFQGVLVNVISTASTRSFGNGTTGLLLSTTVTPRASKIVVSRAGSTERAPRLKPSTVRLPPTIVAVSVLVIIPVGACVEFADDWISPLVNEVLISGMLKLKLPIEALAFAVPGPPEIKAVDAVEVKALAVTNGVTRPSTVLEAVPAGPVAATALKGSPNGVVTVNGGSGGCVIVRLISKSKAPANAPTTPASTSFETPTKYNQDARLANAIKVADCRETEMSGGTLPNGMPTLFI